MSSYLNIDITNPPPSIDFMGNELAGLGLAKSIPNNFSNRKTFEEPGPILVQIVLVVDISKSIYSIKEALKEVEGTSLRTHNVNKVVSGIPSIVRLQEIGEDETAESEKKNGKEPVLEPGSNSIHKLILQDAIGNSFYALEQKRLGYIGMKMPLGSKLLLKGMRFQRGVAMLNEDNVEYLGGRVKELDENSKEVLKMYLEKEGR